MDVSGVGPAAAGAGPTTAARDLALPATPQVAVAADSVAALLRELSQADLTRLLGIVESAPGPGQEAQARELLQTAVSALAAQNPGRALEQLKQLVILDPSRAETLASEPALASIRPAVEQMLQQLTAAAKLNAQGRLAEATHGLQTAAVKEIAAGEVRPETLLLVATGLIEAGGLANYVRSAAVSDVLVDQCRWAPAPHAELVSAGEPAGESHIPVRLLMMAWLAMGIAGVVICWWLQYDRMQAVLEVWGGGVLLLSCLGACQRVWRS